MVEYCKNQQVGNTVRSGRTEILGGKTVRTGRKGIMVKYYKNSRVGNTGGNTVRTGRKEI
jgi:hypothetical protein